MAYDYINEIHYRDLATIEEPLPGSFGLEIEFRSNAPDLDANWLERVLGDPEDPKYMPGCFHLHVETDYEPPVIAFQICDFTDPRTSKIRKENPTTPQDHLVGEQIKAAQFRLMKELSAPSTPVAMTAILLGKVVNAGEMDKAKAAESLMQDFNLGPETAKGLIQRSIERCDKSITR